MPQKYKVFFNHNKVNFVKEDYKVPDNFQTIKDPTKAQLMYLASVYIEQDKNETIFLVCSNLKTTWKTFKSLFRIKKAAGGLVLNKDHQVLFIKRNGLFDLPKGHIEKGESKPETAIREVSEECGISNLKLSNKITKTYHTYILKGQMVLKPSTWYLMNYNGNESPVPQTKEGITDVFWVDQSDLEKYCRNSFPSILSVIKAAFNVDPCASTVKD